MSADAYNPITEAERAGFDLTLVEESLGWTHEQRALRHQEALNLLLELERAGRRIYDGNQSADPASL